jgi:hypothetical protein
MTAVDTILTETVRLRDLDGGRIASGRYIWRGPATVPVFALENCRDVVSDGVDVVCETLCEAVVVIERTRDTPGTIPSTNHGFTRWRVYGNGLAARGVWCRSTIDQNSEHMRLDACSFYSVGVPFDAAGQQSKEHLITHCRFDDCAVAVRASSSVTVIGGAITRTTVAIELTRVGDPVVIQGVGVEACGRVLVTSGPTTASQPVTLSGCRFEADQLHPDGDCILMRHAGVLTVQGSRFGGGAQRIPRIALAGVGTQSAVISGNTFGSYGAAGVCPVRKNPGVTAAVSWGRNVYQRAEGDSQNTHSQTSWRL